jgi:hypothetical protein
LARINWTIRGNEDIIGTALSRYGRFLEQLGTRPSTVSSYVFHVDKYLRFAGTDRPDKVLQRLIGKKYLISCGQEEVAK